MKQSMTITALLLVAAMTRNADAASCQRPDISTDHIQAMFKVGKSAEDIIAACTGEIQRHMAQGESGKGMLAADYEARALAYESLGMGPEAKADHDQAVALAPGFVTWFNRGQFLLDAGLFDAAADDLGKAIAFYDNTPPRERGVATEELWLQAHLTRAEALRRGEHYAEAVADYSVVIAAQPRNDVALANRALSYAHLGNFDADIADLTSVLAVKKNDPIFLYNRGLAWRHKGDNAHALEDFSSAIEQLPGLAVAYVARGGVLEDMGQRDKALEDYRAAAKRDPNLTTASDALARLGEGK